MKLISFAIAVFALLLLSFQLANATETTVYDDKTLSGVATTINVGELKKVGDIYLPSQNKFSTEFVDVHQSKIMFSLGRHFQKPVLEGFEFTGFNVRCVKAPNGMFTFEFYPRWNDGAYEQ